MAQPLRKVTFTAAIIMVLLLGTLLSLGFRQYQLLGHHEQIISQSEKLLFQFATIREQITTTLLEQRYRQLPSIVPEVEELHSKVDLIVKNANIPDEYKLSFINQIDLPGLILLLYKGADQEQIAEVIPKLNQQTRQLGNRLMLFDRLLVNHAKRRVITFQSLVIGILAISIFLIINLLIIGHRRLATPIMELAGQIRQIHQGERKDVALSSPGSSNEITELASAFQNMLFQRQQGSLEKGRHDRILYAIHRAGIACRQAISQQTLFQSVSRALLFNDDYFLIWTGTTETENGTITPTTVVGSASMTEDQCEKCLAVLLEATEEKTPKNNPAMQAESTGKPIILTDLLNDTPQVMLQKTMLEGGYAACVALPLLWRKKVYGVLNLYTLNRETFDDKEIELLAGLAGSMGLALHVFEEEQQLTHEQERTKSLLAALDSPLLTFSTKGEILSCNEMFANLLKISAEQIVNRNWLTILQPVSGALPHEENKDDLLKNLAAKNEEVELKILGNNENRHLYAKISAIYNPDGSIQEFACLGKEFAINTHTDSEINQQCQTVISELSAGVAHEISDLSNGIINYAQVLTDNDPYQQESVEDIEILGKIISSGERIAEVVHKLIFYGQKEHAGGEYLPLTTVLDDAVLLIKHHLKSEGIQLELELNSKSLPIPVHAQIMQQVLINIFNHRRHALNRRYSGHAANKQLTVASDISTEAGKRFFHISFTDQCEDLTAGDIKLFATNDTQAKPTRTLKELLRCRELIQGQGGNMVLENNSDHETISIQIIFPLKG